MNRIKLSLNLDIGKSHKIPILSLARGIENSCGKVGGREGVSKTKTFKEMWKLNWNFHEGKGSYKKEKNLPWWKYEFLYGLK